MTYPHGGAPKRTIDTTERVSTAFEGTEEMTGDLFSPVVNKGSAPGVVFDVTMATRMTAGFSASGTLKVLAGNSETLTADDALPIPTWDVTTDEKVSLEVTTRHPFVQLWFDWSAGGEGDTIASTVAIG